MLVVLYSLSNWLFPFPCLPQLLKGSVVTLTVALVHWSFSGYGVPICPFSFLMICSIIYTLKYGFFCIVTITRLSSEQHQLCSFHVPDVRNQPHLLDLSSGAQILSTPTFRQCTNFWKKKSWWSCTCCKQVILSTPTFGQCTNFCMKKSYGWSCTCCKQVKSLG